jgi:Holliday junction resolvase RusA-like endonuclease
MQFRIFGDPAPQGSKRVFNGRVVEAAGQRLKVWRKAIAEAVEEALPADHQLILGPVKVEVTFYLPRPASIKPSKRPLPIVPPDVDKLCRAALDGLGQGLNGKSGDGRLWADDSLVVELTAIKLYADDTEPGALITVTAL